MLTFRAFVQQPDGFIIISDGTTEVRFSSSEDFRQAEPEYSLPAGCFGVNLEERDGRAHYVFFRGNFPVRGAVIDPEGTTRALLETYIGRVAKYKKG